MTVAGLGGAMQELKLQYKTLFMLVNMHYRQKYGPSYSHVRIMFITAS